MIVFPVKSFNEKLFQAFMSFVICSTDLLETSLALNLDGKTFLLYMIKEFGVQLYIEGKQLSSCNLSTGEVDKNEKTIQIDFEQEYLDQILGSFAQIKDLESKIYVSSASEHIFQKTTSDICGKVGNSCQIILRGDKQFFEPEVENDKIN